MSDDEFERIVTLFRENVRRAALCWLCSPADAEDVTQEVFLKLYVTSKRFESDEHIKAWLLRCTKNKCTDLLRSRKYRDYTPLDSLYDIAAPEPNNDRADGLDTAVLRLSGNLRITLYLHYYEGFSVGETARLLNISVPAVKLRLMRARAKLAEILTAEKENDNGL